MLTRLIRRFIREPENIGNARVREQYGALADVLHMGVFLLLFLGKLLTGLLIHSVTVRVDSFRDLSYFLSALFRAAERRFAGHAPSKVGPRGIRSAKYIISFIAAFAVFEAGFSFFSRVFSRLTTPDSLVPSWIAVLLLVLAVLIRRYVASIDQWIGEKTGNPVLLREAKMVRIDNVMTALGILVILAARLLHFNADYIAAIPVTISVMMTGIMFAVRAVRPAVDEEVDEELVRQVRSRVRECSGIVGCGGIRARFFGIGRRLISMNVAVPASGDPQQTADSLRVIEKLIGEEFGVRLILHARPIDTDDKAALLAYERLDQTVAEMDGRVSFDHFRYVEGKSFSNLIFDLYIPEAYDAERAREIREEVPERMRRENPRYSCVFEVHPAP